MITYLYNHLLFFPLAAVPPADADEYHKHEHFINEINQNEYFILKKRSAARPSAVCAYINNNIYWIFIKK